MAVRVDRFVFGDGLVAVAMAWETDGWRVRPLVLKGPTKHVLAADINDTVSAFEAASLLVRILQSGEADRERHDRAIDSWMRS